MDSFSNQSLLPEQEKLLHKLYQRCFDANQLLNLFLDKEGVSQEIERWNKALQWETQRYMACSQNNNPADKLRYEQAVETRNAVIDLMDNQARETLLRYFKQGEYVVFGYRSIKDPLFRIIPNREWNFLTLDYEKNKASFEDVTYYGLRFISAQALKELPEAESLAFHILSNRLDPIPPISNEDIDISNPLETLANEDESSGNPVETLANQAPKIVKPLGETNLRRIESLKKFVALISKIAQEKKIDLNLFALRCSKATLLKALQDWEVKTTKTKDRVWSSLKSMDDDLWKSAEARSICRVVLSSSQMEKNFFEQFKIHKHL